MATTERSPNGEYATSPAQPIVEQGRRELTLTSIATALRHPRWRTQRTRELFTLASEADMFIWEKVRLRDLRDDLDAEINRRRVHESVDPSREIPRSDPDALELVDFERDSWPQ
ncbi:MAG TPA: hypothetical protein VGO31_01745 [Microbacteriaceae bacterium]|jgi:hypothetical protein|nr:hypothetical protein [Microbacteriaceae bacterium]